MSKDGGRLPAVVLSVVPELLAKISWAVRCFTRLANPSDRSSIVLALKSQSWQIVILSTHRSSKQARKPDLETCFRVQSQGNMTPAHVTLSWESASTLTHTYRDTAQLRYTNNDQPIRPHPGRLRPAGDEPP